MEDEIDIRPYVVALLRGWRYLLGATLGLALIVFGWFKFVETPSYEAKALVIPMPPLYDLVLSQEFTTNENLTQRGYQILPELARADQVMQLLLEQTQPILSTSETEEITLDNLRDITSVDVEDANSMYLIVAHADPAVAQHIVNLWADILILEVNRIFGEGQDEISFLETELDSADAQRAAAEQAVIDFMGQDSSILLVKKQVVLEDDYNRVSVEQVAILRLVRDIESLRSQLALQPGAKVITLGDELSLMSMQFRLYNASSSNYQLEVNITPGEAGKTTAEAISLLDKLSEIAQEKYEGLRDRELELESEIIALQQSVEAADTQFVRLKDERSLTIDMYRLLTTKLAESRITTQESLVSYMKVGSYAALPSRPQSPRGLTLVAAGGGVGFFFTAVILVALEYLRNHPLVGEPLPRQTDSPDNA